MTCEVMPKIEGATLLHTIGSVYRQSRRITASSYILLDHTIKKWLLGRIMPY